MADAPGCPVGSSPQAAPCRERTSCTRQYVRVGMFDWYEPDPAIKCPRCDSSLVTPWQGKDGPNALFLWRERRSTPVEHLVDDEVRWNGEELERFSLPDGFEIYTDCHKGHYVVAAGRCVDRMWAATQGVTAYESMHEYVEAERRRR